MEFPAAPVPSLVKYESPLGVGDDVAAKGKGSSKTVDVHLEEILNSVLPPRMWTAEEGSTWMQYVAKEAASRLDVITLQEALDQRLMQRQAREMGICPVREDLYSQTFDELIRQVTIESPERGLLLLRVRDEIRMTMDAYKTLYDSSVTFGVRKQLQAEQGIPELEAKVDELQSTKKDLENTVISLRNQVEMIEKRETERRQLDEKKRKEEIEFLKHQGKHLDLFLKQMGAGK